jgi:uncharacterized membrane-anchored protein
MEMCNAFAPSGALAVLSDEFVPMGCCQPDRDAIKLLLPSADQQTREQKFVAWMPQGGASDQLGGRTRDED